MADELEATKKNLEIQLELAHRLNIENEGYRRQLNTQSAFYVQQIDMITAHRDRLAATIRGILTRFKVIRECFTKCEQEALEEGLEMHEASTENTAEVKAPKPVESPKLESDELETALRDLALGDPVRNAIGLLPINQM